VFSITSVGELAAPVLGGVLYEKAGYASVFWLSAGLLAVDFAMRLLVVEKKVARRYEAQMGKRSRGPAREDGHGHGHDEEQEADEEQPLLGTKDEEKYKIPPGQNKVVRTIPVLYCFRNASLLAAMLVAFVQALLLGVVDSTVSTEAEEVLGFDSLKAGLLYLPIGVVNAILGPVAGWCVDKYGTKAPAVFGYSFLVPVLVALRFIDHDGQGQLILYCVLLALLGVGLAAIGAPSIVEAGAVVQRYNEANPELFGENGPYAQLYGINSMVFNLGLTIGPLLAGGLKSGIGYGNMNGVIAGLCLGTAIICFFYIGGKPRRWWPRF
jgi:MFS family permease